MRSIKMMADYHCWPLWEASAGRVGNIDPRTLPISRDLVVQLESWARLYDARIGRVRGTPGGIGPSIQPKIAGQIRHGSHPCGLPPTARMFQMVSEPPF
jgi:hypothetical protein